MIERNPAPILEFDDAPVAKLNPGDFGSVPFDTDRLVITFFPEVLDALLSEGAILPSRQIPGENPVQLYAFADRPDILITLGQVGCPACAGNLDLFNAMGIRRAVFCGGAGVLDKTIEVGRLLLVDGAIRDEGFSYHYFAPSRVIYNRPEDTEKIARYLDAHDIPYLRGLTWTTDAIFRETADRIALRRAEGAKMVEMEQAGCIAVARFRNFSYAALIYGGDDLTGQEWSSRSWRSRKGIRYDLVALCKKLADEL